MALEIRNKKLKDILETTQGKTYSTLIVTLAVAVLMFVFAIAPAYMSVTNKLVENKEKKSYIDELEKKQKIMSELAIQKTSYLGQINLLQTLYPDQSNDEFYMANIDAVASKYSCTLNSISFSNNQSSLPNSDLTNYSMLKRTPISFQINCSLEGIQSFLNHIEEFPAVISISSLSFGINEEELKQSAINENFKYFLNIQAEYFFWNYSNE